VKRSKVEPGSQTNGYDGPPYVEGQHNTGGSDGKETRRKGEDASAPAPDRIADEPSASTD
jgi:hypothetical protein